MRLERLENSRYTAINERGGTISVGTGDGTDFTPVELLLVSIGGCTAVDVDLLTSRRAEPDSFEIVVEAEKIRDTAGNHLADHRRPDGSGWITLADPEGNEFCILSRAPAASGATT